MSDAVQIQLIASAGTITVAAIAAYFAYKAKEAARDTHKAVNSRLTQLLALAKKSSHAEGKLEGETKGKAGLKPGKQEG